MNFSVSRRQWLQITAWSTVAPFVIGASAMAQNGERLDFTLPPLPYPEDALAPFIDAETMALHHGKHHASYVAKLNAALANHPHLRGQSLTGLLTHLESLPPDIQTAVRDHGGGHYNHSLFWPSLKVGGGEPKGELRTAIDNAFGSVAKLNDQLKAAGMSVFGSGWTWLSLNRGTLQLDTTANQDSPVTQGAIPLLGLDVWEHAYYLKYQNRRAEYLDALTQLIDWDVVLARYQEGLRAD